MTKGPTIRPTPPASSASTPCGCGSRRGEDANKGGAIRTLAFLALFLAAPAWAAPFALQVGDARLGFDLPAGVTDSTPTGSPRLIELAESFTAASDRILLFDLTHAANRRLNNRYGPEL